MGYREIKEGLDRLLDGQSDEQTVQQKCLHRWKWSFSCLQDMGMSLQFGVWADLARDWTFEWANAEWWPTLRCARNCLSSADWSRKCHVQPPRKRLVRRRMRFRTRPHFLGKDSSPISIRIVSFHLDEAIRLFFIIIITEHHTWELYTYTYWARQLDGPLKSIWNKSKRVWQ